MYACWLRFLFYVFIYHLKSEQTISLSPNIMSENFSYCLSICFPLPCYEFCKAFDNLKYLKPRLYSMQFMVGIHFSIFPNTLCVIICTERTKRAI